MKKVIGIVVILVVYYLMMVYLIGMFSGVILQDVWEMLMVGKSLKVMIQIDLVVVLGNVFCSLEVLKIWFGIVIVLFVVVVVFIFVYREELKMYFGREVLIDECGIYGIVDWMKMSEVKKVFRFGSEQKGILLGKVNGECVVLLVDIKYNKYIVIFGVLGIGKLRMFVRLNIIQIVKMGKSMIIIDLKGEFFEDMVVWLEQQGYDVKVLNFVNIEYFDRWNLLDVVVDDMDVMVFVDVVIRNIQIGVKKVGGDLFWDRVELNLFKVFVLYIKEIRLLEEQNFGELYRLLVIINMVGLQNMFMSILNDCVSKMVYNIFVQVFEQVRMGVIIGFGIRLQVFQNRFVQKMMEVSDIDLEVLKRRKVVYFCIISDIYRVFSFLSLLFFSFLFIKFVNLYDMIIDFEIRVREVYFLLDEFFNIGEIFDFQEKIVIICFRRLYCSIIFQSLGQFGRIYQQSWEDIIVCCDMKYFFGCNDLKIVEYVLMLFGMKLIYIRLILWQGGLEGLIEIEWIMQLVGKR